MKLKLQFYLFLVIWGHSSVVAQTPFIQHYTSKLYKGGFQTWQVAQDAKQIIYVANSDAILRYDGNKWESIICTVNTFARVLHTSNNGTIYLGGDNLIGYLETRPDGSTVIRSLTDKLPKEIIKNLAVYTIKANDKSVVFANSEMLYIYDLATKEFAVIPSSLKSLWSIGYSDIFVFQNKVCVYNTEGLFYVEGKQLKPWSKLIASLPQVTLSYIGNFPDKNDMLYALSEDHELLLLSLKNSTVTHTKKISGKINALIKNKDIFIIEGLHNGLIAINILEEGLIILNTKGDIIYQIKREQGLNGNTYNHIYEDKMNNLWLTGHEVSQVMLSSPIDYYYQPTLQGDPILALAQHNSKQYVGSASRIEYQTSDKNFRTLINTNSEIWNFFEFDDQCFATTSAGLFVIDNNKSTLLLEENYVMCLEKINAQTYLFGTYHNGLNKLSKVGDTWKSTKIKGIDGEIRFIKKDAQENIWIGNYAVGIRKLKLNAALDSVISKKEYGTPQGLPSSVNNRIYRFKDGSLTFTTEDGFYQYDAKNDRFEPHPDFREALKNKCVYNFVEHPSGDVYVWISERNPGRQVGGVLRKQKSGTYTLNTRPFHRVENPANNFIVDVDVPMLVLENGKVWFAIGDRLYEYNPEKENNIKKPFRMSITSVKAGDTQQQSKLLAKNSIIIDNAPIPFDLNKLYFQFTAHHYKEESKIQYRYFLEGQDQQWSEWSYQSSVNFTNLNEGKYILYVKAKDIYDLESDTVKYAFEIKAPFYRTWWAYLIYLSLITVLVVIIVNIYTKNLRAQTSILEKRVEERTREIQQINEEILAQKDDIMAMNDVLRRQQEEVKSQATKLQEANQIKNRLFSIISHDLRSPLNQLMATLQIFRSGDFSEKELQKILPELGNSVQSTLSLTDNLLFWAKSQMEGLQTMPEILSINSLIRDNVQLFDPIATRKEIKIKNQTNADTKVYADREMIKLVFRNLINNAVKFCEKGGKITISAKNHPDKNEVEILIKDTGVGIEKNKLDLLFSNQMQSSRGTSNEKGTGLGLILCKEFLEKNKGSIRVESTLAKGSSFYITLPITA